MGCERILSYILATWRQFVFRMGIKLHILDAETNPTIVDEEVVISPIMIDRPIKHLHLKTPAN